MNSEGYRLQARLPLTEPDRAQATPGRQRRPGSRRA
jgi:hypothetical protein